MRSTLAPKVAVEMGNAWMPGWVLMLATVLAGLVPIALVAQDRGQVILLLLVLLFVLANPDGMGAGVFVLAVGVAYLLGAPAPFAGPIHLLVLAVAAVSLLASLLPGVPLMARVELRILRRPVARLAAVQLIVQPMVWLGATMAGSGAVVAWMPLAAGTGLAVGAWWLQQQLSAQRRR